MYRAPIRTVISVVAVIAIAIAAVGLSRAGATHAADPAQGGVVRFATLPAVTPAGTEAPGHPEGMTVDATGNFYVASFELVKRTQPFKGEPPRRKGKPGPLPSFDLNLIYIFAPNGKYQDAIPLLSGVVPLGLQFDAAGNLYVLDVIDGTVIKYQPPLSRRSTPAHVYHLIDSQRNLLCGGFFAGCALNGIAGGIQRPSPDGNLYITDSVGGSIYKLDPSSRQASVFIHDPQLLPANSTFPPPPFGANGLAFDPTGTALYIDNMSTGVIYKVAVQMSGGSLTHGALSTFATGLSGPDDMLVDSQGNLWVSNGQLDQVVGLNPQGAVIQRIGSFDGVSHDGAPKGLLMPSSIVLIGGHLYVDNEANPSIHPVPPTPNGWDDFTLFTVSRMNCKCAPRVA